VIFTIKILLAHAYQTSENSKYQLTASQITQEFL